MEQVALGQEKSDELRQLAVEIRKEILKGIASIGKGHVGGSLSMADLLAVLYGAVMRYDPKDPGWKERDYLVTSKGHAGPAVYAALAIEGFFPREWLYTLNQPGTRLPSHTDRNKTPGVDMTTGSLGQGASTAAGLACAGQMDGTDQYTYLVLGDGECNEGQVWEMAAFAAKQRLDHLIAFVDNNGMQADGPTEMICDMGGLAEKFRAFGFFVQQVDGHDVEQIYQAVQCAQSVKGKPKMIILDTIKGKGIREVEQMANCHSIAVGQEQLERWLKELDADAAAREVRI